MLGFGALARKVFGTPNDRKVKSVRPLVAKINALEPEFAALSDEGIIEKTREFQRRVGDPNQGGSTGIRRMTAYRQDALRCLSALEDGALKGAEVAKAAGVARATALMRADHYGWFQRVETGVYALSPKGQTALAENAGEIARLRAAE